MIKAVTLYITLNIVIVENMQEKKRIEMVCYDVQLSTYSYILCTSEIVSLASVTRATSPFSYTYSKLRLGGQAHQLVNMNIPKKNWPPSALGQP